MLVYFRYSEVGEDDRKYENIIYRKGFLDKISRQELEGFLFSEPCIDKDIEDQCERYPYS